MVVIRWKNPLAGGVQGCCGKLRNFVTVFRSSFSLALSRFSFNARCLTYNEHVNYNYVIEVLLEPVHWFVDNFAKCVGKIFVFCVCVMTAAVVAIAYWLGLPYWWDRSAHVTIFLLLFGNWLLLNIVFHYYMAVTTPPGCPPNRTVFSDTASLCKKCIAPKPQRTHHCSVCDRCILAMDHHCPWLNNCVGYFNARYFYLYMVYMLAGVMFIVVAGIELGYQVVWLNDTGGLVPNNDPDLVGHGVVVNDSGALVAAPETPEYDEDNAPRHHDLPLPSVTITQRIAAHLWKRRAVCFVAYTCVGVLVALGVLAVMHGRNIGRGETSVEAHGNKIARAASRYFRNPYDFGWRENWRMFLGLAHAHRTHLGVLPARRSLRHVLLPSAHAPPGDGVYWRTVHGPFQLAPEDIP